MNLDKAIYTQLKAEGTGLASKVLLVTHDNSVVIEDAKGGPIVLNAETVAGLGAKLATGDVLQFSAEGIFERVQSKAAPKATRAAGVSPNFDHQARHRAI